VVHKNLLVAGCMLIIDNTHLSGVHDGKHKSSQTSADLLRTVHELQSTVETLQRAGDQTVPVCNRLESLNDLVHRNTGSLHEAALTACVQTMTRFVCLFVSL